MSFCPGCGRKLAMEAYCPQCGWFVGANPGTVRSSGSGDRSSAPDGDLPAGGSGNPAAGWLLGDLAPMVRDDQTSARVGSPSSAGVPADRGSRFPGSAPPPQRSPWKGLVVVAVALVVLIGVGVAFLLPRLSGSLDLPGREGAAEGPQTSAADVVVSGTIPGSEAARRERLSNRSISDDYLDGMVDSMVARDGEGALGHRVILIEVDGDPETFETIIADHRDWGTETSLGYERPNGDFARLDITVSYEYPNVGAYTRPGETVPQLYSFSAAQVVEGLALQLPEVIRVDFASGEPTIVPLFGVTSNLGDSGQWEPNKIVMPEVLQAGLGAGEYWPDRFDETPQSVTRVVPENVKGRIRGHHEGQELAFDDYIWQALSFEAQLEQEVLAQTDPADDERLAEMSRQELRQYLEEFFEGALRPPGGASATVPIPSEVPTCPSGMSPISWTEYEGGSILLCSTGERVQVVYTDAAGAARTPATVAFAVGGFALGFADGSQIVCDGATVRSQAASGDPIEIPATATWRLNETQVTAPSSGQASCPAGSWQLARTTWEGGWLLVCGTDQRVPTRLIYSDAGTTGTSDEVQGGADVYCAQADGKFVCGYRDGRVTIDDATRSATGNDWPAAPTPELDPPKLSSGTWVTVLESIDKATVPLADAYARAKEISDAWGVEVYVFDSTATPGMNPGWWALTLISYDSNKAARAACATVGRVPSGECYGRQITG